MWYMPWVPQEHREWGGLEDIHWEVKMERVGLTLKDRLKLKRRKK
jgi:hypothetical protein